MTAIKSLKCGAVKDFDVTKLLTEHSKAFILIRGMPGSGKSTLARKIINKTCSVDWYEADMYFVVDMEYRFNPQQLADAHDWCEMKAMAAMCANRPYVIVSNTSVDLNACEIYLTMAHFYGYDIIIIDMNDYWGSIHNVPEATMKKMALRWVETEKIIKDLDDRLV